MAEATELESKPQFETVDSQIRQNFVDEIYLCQDLLYRTQIYKINHYKFECSLIGGNKIYLDEINKYSHNLDILINAVNNNRKENLAE